MSNPQLRRLLCPQWRKMDILTDLPSMIHFLGFPVQFREHQLNRSQWIRRRDLELQFELVLDHLVIGPALARPFEALFVGLLYFHPVVVLLFVVLDVLDQQDVLFFESVEPLRVCLLYTSPSPRD